MFGMNCSKGSRIDDGVDVAAPVDVATVAVDDDLITDGNVIDGRARVGSPIEMPPPTTGSGIRAAFARAAKPATEILE